MNTLISIFCFILVVFIISILLLKLHVEYITFLILLLYLGGILIFFLFTALMLNNEYNSDKIITKYSFENILLFILFFKTFYLISCLNFKISLFKSLSLVQYLPTYIENNYFLKNFTENHSDVVNFVSLYTEKSLLLIILGFILLFTMLGVIVITKKKYV